MTLELKLIRFRFLQMYRALQHIGWGYVLVVLPILFIGLLSFLAYVTKLENKNLLLFGYVLMVMMVHFKRKDFDFLSQLKANKTILFILEYSLLCLPYTLILSVLKLFPQLLIGHVLVFILSSSLAMANLKVLIPASNWALSMIPNFLFEWKGCIRQFNVGFIALWILGLFMATHELAYFIFIFMFAGMISAAFKPTEGKELKPTTPSELYIKIARNSSFLNILLLPHFMVYQWYNGDFWYILVGIIFYFMLYQGYCISYKYANYVQYKDVKNDLPTAIFIFLCPFLPFSLALLLQTFRRAKRNL